MESEKVKEIKKAIEYNSVSEFMNRLPYADEFNKLKMVSFDDILTLINELESENERLLNEKWDCQDDLDNYHIENQQLKDRIAELEEDKEKWQRKAVNYYQKVKSYGIECIIDSDIDETLKECL